MARLGRIFNIIYAIGFGIFYCHSQSLLRNIKETIDMASDFFYGVSYGLKKVNAGLKTVEDVIVAEKDEKCEFKCPNGEIPVRNKKYKSKPNGCGAYGIQLSTKDLPAAEMTDCCNQHDICYGTCLNKKDKCDLDFDKCLTKVCDKENNKRNKDAFRNCRTTSKLLYLGTLALGCKAFKDGQSLACWCSGRSDL